MNDKDKKTGKAEKKKNDSTDTGLHRNLISYLGVLITFIGAFLTIFSLVVMVSLKTPSPYIGIFSYMIFPGIVGFGLFVIFFGMWKESRRRKKSGSSEALPYPMVDLNDKRHRRKFAYVSVGGFFIVILLGFVGYNAFLFTESNTFCGKLCHVVMEPEYTAYQHSPHAKVHCIECHVGSGVSFYVKSKLSGVRQVFGVLFNNYERPIKTPLENLRPAREVCEACHWPEKFYGAQLLQIPYYRYDEENTSDQISLMVKTGGGDVEHGLSTGIHWHMIIDNTIEFAATDYKLQEIPWFRVTGSYGQVREYMTIENPVSKEELKGMEVHTLDCMDCHNRPSHAYPPPDHAIDLALQNGSIKSDIPWIKKVTAEALMDDHKDHESAEKEIRNSIFDFYAKDYPEVYNNRRKDIETAVEVSLKIYKSSVFPKMNVDWTTYPENIGHRNWPGCFRCHDGKHQTEDGKILSNSCTLCHTMPQRGPIEELGAMIPESEETWHPFPLTGKHAEILCNECHAAGIRPSADCLNCHVRPTDGPMGDFSCLDCHVDPGVKAQVASCNSDCHGPMTGDHQAGMHGDAECTDCHKPHNWVVTERSTCESCHDDRAEHYPESFCGECHEFTEG